MERPERLSLQSADGAQLNLDALYQIAPSCFTEAADPKTGKIKRVVNFDVLRQLLGDDTVEDATEAYEFNWMGKQEARAEVLRPINKTLRPVKEDSVDWDNTQNLYIEGDNLEVLKLLQKSYLGKVKMIYIDPPYNTGNDFVYHDDFAQSQSEYDAASGAVDELGNRYRKNTDSNGKYHSDWCSMIYSRLMIARSLLSEDGVIFISIDDNEVENLRKICDEIFGSDNFVANYIWEKKKKPSFLNANIGTKTEYIVCYSKDRTMLGALSVDTTEEGKKYPFNNAGNSIANLTFPKGSVKFNMKDCVVEPQDMSEGNIITSLESELHIVNGTNENDFTLRGEWRYSQAKLDEIVANKEGIVISKIPFRPNHIKQGGEIKKMHNLLSIDNYKVGTNEDATAEQTKLLGKNYFDYAKPSTLIQLLVKASTYSETDAIIMDFFSGSGTTAQSVFMLNAEDKGNRKSILVQLPEKTDEESEARKDGYDNICEIGKERIRRAGKKIKEESPLTTQDLDTGFRVFRVDESNFEDVERTPKEYHQEQLELFLNNVKSDRDDLDLLFGCMLDWGVQLSLPMSSEEVDGKMIYTVNDGDLVACFAEKVTDSVVRAMADKQPLRVIFRDSCFAQDADKINIYETFKQLLDWSDKDVEKNIRVI